MKKYLSKRALWKSLLSVVALGIFILLATGSLDFLNDKTEYLGDGVYKTTEYYSEDETEIITGKQDDKGRWQGPVTIEVDEGSLLSNHTEEVNMINGKRHGKSKVTGQRYFGEPYVYYNCYNMDIRIDCEESAHKNTAVISSYQVLSNKYPWFLYKLNTFGFEDEFVEAYMDTLETVLGTYVFEYIEFDSIYSEAVSDLEKSEYDTLIGYNSLFFIYQGLEEVKNDELRLAVIDRYRSDGNSTYNIINTTYPGYLLTINNAGVNNQDFDGFTKDLDSLMTSYGLLDLEDPFFLDSVDARMYRALSSMSPTKKSSSSSAIKSLKSAPTFPDYMHLKIISIWNDVVSEYNPFSLSSSPAEVTDVVANFMLTQFDQGDIIKRAVREAYFLNKGVISVPTVTTEFIGIVSATSVDIQGYVIEDGGAEIASRGIAWASMYNPATNDNSKASGTGTGIFSVTLDGLTEGITYYARTFATNSAGTAYGNCVEFTSTSTSGIESTEFDRDLNIYPNPTSSITTFSFQLESAESMVLTILNLKGQVAYQNDLGTLPQGLNRFDLDLTGFSSGIYNCQISNNGNTKLTRKLIITD